MKNNTVSVNARAVALPIGEQSAPEWIMYLPGGEHTAEATVDGKPEAITYIVDEATAKALNASLQTVLSAEGPEPFLSFDHAPTSTKASAWPREFAWKDGAVKCRVEWTPAGADAVTVRAKGQLPTYRYFSPSFRFDRRSRKITGIDLPEAGSLVNDPAFRAIAKVTAAQTDVAAPAVPNPNKPTMNYEKIAKAAMAALGMTEEEAAGEDAENILTSKVDALKGAATSVKASRASELATVKASLAAAEAELQKEREARADDAIAAAVKAQRIAPKDTETITFYRDALLRDHTAAVKALQKLPAIVPADSGADTPGAKGTPNAADAEKAENERYARVSARAAAMKATHPNLSHSERFGLAEKLEQ